MKIRKFILTDYEHNNWENSVLVEFEEDVDKEQIEDIISKVKELYPTMYEREDILRAFDELGNWKPTYFEETRIIEF